MSNPKNKSKKARKKRARAKKENVLTSPVPACRFAKLYIPLDASRQSDGSVSFQPVQGHSFSPAATEISAAARFSIRDNLENQQDYSIHSEINKGDAMTAKDKKKKDLTSPAQKKASKKPVPAPGKDKAAEIAFLEETADYGQKIYQAIDEMDPAASQAAPAKAKENSTAKPKEEKETKKEVPASSKESVVPAPGMNKADEMDFLKTTADEGAVIFEAIAKMGEEPIAQFQASGEGSTPACPAPVKDDAPVIPQPGVDEAAEMAFIAQTTKYGAKIYEAIAEMDKAAAKETKPAAPKPEKKAAPAPKKSEPAKEAEPVKETKKEVKPEKTQPVPGMDKADEFDFLETTAAEGAKIYQSIADMYAKGQRDASNKTVKTTVTNGKFSPAQKPVVKESKSEGGYSKITDKPAKKTDVTLGEDALATYRSLGNDTLLEMANALGIEKDLNTLTNEIIQAKNLEDYTEDLVLKALNSGKDFTFEEDGFDAAVIPVLVKRIADTLPFKASDLTDLSNAINEALTMNLGDDAMANADLYHRLFDHVRSILMRGQKQGATTIEELQVSDDADLRKLIEHFMDVAYDLLPYWQYDDVKFYEGFIFAVLSQFRDLADLHNRAMMDVADLYIKHGDYGRGDADYNYLIRENNLKDQIFYRFANVYRPFDLQKAKNIAGSALQYVDGRYEYYPKLIEILESW